MRIDDFALTLLIKYTLWFCSGTFSCCRLSLIAFHYSLQCVSCPIGKGEGRKLIWRADEINWAKGAFCKTSSFWPLPEWRILEFCKRLEVLEFRLSPALWFYGNLSHALNALISEKKRVTLNKWLGVSSTRAWQSSFQLVVPQVFRPIMQRGFV